MLHEVLYHAEPSWLIGESGEERYARVGALEHKSALVAERYPGVFSGQVISKRAVADIASGKLPSLRGMASREWPVIELDLPDESASAGNWKILDGKLEPVTFDDRFGAVAVKLRERSADPETWELDDHAAREAAEAANAEAMRAHDQATREWQALKETFPQELHEWSISPDGIPPAFPERPKALVLVEVPESSFDREAASLASTLPPTITHTGTGLYSTKETPTKVDAAQVGAPAGQVITFDPISNWIEVASQLNGQTGIRSMVELSGELYGSTETDGRLFKWNGTTAWTQVAPEYDSQGFVRALVVLGGEIYGCTGGGGRLLKWNGVNAWTQVAPQYGTQSDLYSLVVLDGEIYAGTNPSGNLLKWNGTNAWTLAAGIHNAQGTIRALVVLSGEIYGCTSTGGRLFKWDGANDWIEVAGNHAAEGYIYSLVVLAGEIYGGTYDQGYLFKWNGTNAWVTVTTSRVELQRYIWSLVVLDGEIYGGTGSNGMLFKWNGVDDWVMVADQLNAQSAISSLLVFNGKIYGGTFGGGRLFEYQPPGVVGTDAFTGGYVTNVTRTETRAIISHTADTATLEGVLTNWTDTDDLDIYDAWSTIQAALDQLFTDQGAAAFTASQYIRVFAGTYDENVVPNATLAPVYGNEALVVEGDSTDDRDNIIIAPAAGDGFTVNGPDNVVLRHLKVAPVGGTTAVNIGAGSYCYTVSDVHVVCTCTNGIVTQVSGLVEDCVVDHSSNSVSKTGIYCVGGTVVRSVARSTNGTRKGLGITCSRSGIVGCTAAGYVRGIHIVDGRFLAIARIAQCTVYDCDDGVAFVGGYMGIHLELVNTVISGCTDCIQLTSGYPEETATVFGPRWTLRNNCFHDYTNFANDGSTPKTYAQIAAMDRCDASGDIFTDPLMTAPATGDFSLQTSSPCKWTGHGSGVVADYRGVVFDPQNPDIGGWSSGIVPAPTWAADTSNIIATNLATGGEVGLTWDEAAATVLTNLSKGYIIESRTVSGPGAYVEHGRSDTEAFTVGALIDDAAREFRVTAYTRVSAEPSSVPSDTDEATPTGVAIPDAPEITATDLLNQSDVKVDIVAGNAADVSTIFYRIVPGGVLQTWGNTVTGDGSKTLTLTVKPYVIYAVAQRGGCNSVPSNLEFVNVQAADKYTAMRTALYEWVKGVVGNPTVLWREPNAPQPARQYVSIKMNPTTPVGSDYHSAADIDGIETVSGDREYIFSIQVHGKPANEDGSASISILERLRSSLEKRSVQATLCAAGLAFVAEEGFGDLAGIGGTEWEARVFMDIRFRTTYQDTDEVGFIGTVETPVGTLE